MKRTNDIHIHELRPLISPVELKDTLPMSEKISDLVIASRNSIRRILFREDNRMLAIVGPCSIHDEEAALEYAERLKKLRDEFEDRIYLVMRVYFEKPRTTVGWRGLIIDPYLNGTYNIADGIYKARKLLLTILEMGLPSATELLDPIIPQYIADLISWAAIGARTTESQTHRNMASGLSMPIGFKNSTEGNLQIAIDAMHTARNRHSFMGIDSNGRTCILDTLGNHNTHIVLRGSRERTNYRQKDIKKACRLLNDADFPTGIMIDCSHGNSGKKHERQSKVLRSIIKSRLNGMKQIIGFMLESNLNEGCQAIPKSLNELKYGISITDECIGWRETEELLRSAYKTLAV